MLQLLDAILYASGRRDAEENPRKKHKKCDENNDNEVHQSMNSRGSGGEVSRSEVQVQQIDAQPDLPSAQNGQIGEMIVVRQEEELEVGEEERNAKAVVTTAEPLGTFPDQASQVQSSQAETFGTSSSDDGFPGGPEDTSVLKSFRHHIAHAIWKGKYREALCTKWSGGALGSWKYTDECPNFQDKISKTGLQCVIDATYTKVNRALISALVERWHPETNTFHFPCGEMTITIDDVVQLTGLKADGRAFSGDGHVSADYAKFLLKNGLGYTEKGVDELFSSSRGYTLKFTQLRDTFRGKCTNDDDEEMIDHHVRAYILYFFGAILFSDKSGNLVNLSYLAPIMDVAKIGDYSFATAVLSYTYRQLGVASRSGVAQIAGYFTLLEAWAYAHIGTNIGSVACNPNYNDDMPMMCKWIPNKPDDPTLEYVKKLRLKFDELYSNEVIWQPYDRKVRPLIEMTWYKGILVCLDVFEPHHPDRVLRQFGMVQKVPSASIAMGSKSKLGKDYAPIYKPPRILLESFQEDWHNHTLSVEARSKPLTKPGEQYESWIEWYKRTSHRFVENPHRRDAEDGVDNLTLWRKGVTDAIYILRRGMHASDDELRNNVVKVIASLTDLPDIQEGGTSGHAEEDEPTMSKKKPHCKQLKSSSSTFHDSDTCTDGNPFPLDPRKTRKIGSGSSHTRGDGHGRGITKR